MSRANNTKINIILDGNSIPNLYQDELTTKLTALYGAGNYTFVNISVGGQTIDDMITRINQYCKNSMQGFASKNILVFQEIRNQVFVAGNTYTEAYNKAKTYCQTIRAALPSTCTLKIGIITPIADDDTTTAMPNARSLILADTSGDWDFVIDLYNYSDAGGAFNDYTSGFYQVDQTHPNATGQTAAGNFVGDSIHTLYP